MTSVRGFVRAGVLAFLVGAFVGCSDNSDAVRSDGEAGSSSSDLGSITRGDSAGQFSGRAGSDEWQIEYERRGE